MDDLTNHHRDATVTLHLGDNVTVFLTLPDAPVDATVTVESEESRSVVSLRIANKGQADTVPASTGVRIDVPEVAALLLNLFTEEGNPEALTVAQLADRLAAADPATWGRWNDRTDRLAMVGRTLKGRLKKAGLDIPTTRLKSVAGQPTAYREVDIRAAIRKLGAAQ